MGQAIARELVKLERLLDGDLDAPAVVAALELLGAARHHATLLAEARIYNDYLPKAREVRPTQRERALHLLWDAFDKLPMSVVVDFAIPFRRMVAERLFRRCGSSFIADEGVRFNFGQLLEVGDDVFLNRGVFLDTKGGVTIGDAACLTEWVAVFTHSHSESDHAVRSYAPVDIRPYAKIYSDAIILPGVTVGEEGIVAARSPGDARRAARRSGRRHPGRAHPGAPQRGPARRGARPHLARGRRVPARACRPRASARRHGLSRTP